MKTVKSKRIVNIAIAIACAVAIFYLSTNFLTDKKQEALLSLAGGTSTTLMGFLSAIIAILASIRGEIIEFLKKHGHYKRLITAFFILIVFFFAFSIAAVLVTAQYIPFALSAFAVIIVYFFLSLHDLMQVIIRSD